MDLLNWYPVRYDWAQNTGVGTGEISLPIVPGFARMLVACYGSSFGGTWTDLRGELVIGGTTLNIAADYPDPTPGTIKRIIIQPGQPLISDPNSPGLTWRAIASGGAGGAVTASMASIIIKRRVN